MANDDFRDTSLENAAQTAEDTEIVEDMLQASDNSVQGDTQADTNAFEEIVRGEGPAPVPPEHRDEANNASHNPEPNQDVPEADEQAYKALYEKMMQNKHLGEMLAYYDWLYSQQTRNEEEDEEKKPDPNPISNIWGSPELFSKGSFLFATHIDGFVNTNKGYTTIKCGNHAYKDDGNSISIKGLKTLFTGIGPKEAFEIMSLAALKPNMQQLSVSGSKKSQAFLILAAEHYGLTVLNKHGINVEQYRDKWEKFIAQNDDFLKESGIEPVKVEGHGPAPDMEPEQDSNDYDHSPNPAPPTDDGGPDNDAAAAETLNADAQASPEEDPELYKKTELKKNASTDDDTIMDLNNVVDPLYEDALKFVAEKQYASHGVLKKHFGIGGDRASSIMKTLQTEGHIGPYIEGRRDIHIKPEDLAHAMTTEAETATDLGMPTALEPRAATADDLVDMQKGVEQLMQGQAHEQHVDNAAEKAKATPDKKPLTTAEAAKQHRNSLLKAALNTSNNPDGTHETPATDATDAPEEPTAKEAGFPQKLDKPVEPPEPSKQEPVIIEPRGPEAGTPSADDILGSAGQNFNDDAQPPLRATPNDAIDPEATQEKQEKRAKGFIRLPGFPKRS